MSQYYSEEPQENYRDPLKPFLIALIVLLLLFAVIVDRLGFCQNRRSCRKYQQRRKQ